MTIKRNVCKTSNFDNEYMKIIYVNYIYAIKKWIWKQSLQLWTLLDLMSSSENKVCTRFEPMSSVIQVQHYTSWVNKPTGSWSLCWFRINLWYIYCEDLCIGCTFLHKFWAKNPGCSLYTRPLLSQGVHWLVAGINWTENLLWITTKHIEICCW